MQIWVKFIFEIFSNDLERPGRPLSIEYIDHISAYLEDFHLQEEYYLQLL